jgi:threonine/homoserine/homoserine lactone efflux protein
MGYCITSGIPRLPADSGISVAAGREGLLDGVFDGFGCCSFLLLVAILAVLGSLLLLGITLEFPNLLKSLGAL